MDSVGTGPGNRIPGFLSDWVGRQRWFTGRGRTPRWVGLGSWALDSRQPGVDIRTYLLLDAAPEPTVYQVPVTTRSAELPGMRDALIHAGADAVGTPQFSYDAPHDPAYAAALLRLVTSSAAVMGDAASAEGTAMPGIREATLASSRVFGGEQSNTSIICELGAPERGSRPQLICKIFRTVHDGNNPDIEVQTALAGAGSPYVPAPIGWVRGTWHDPRIASAQASGHLAFAQEFLPGVRDAWQVALDAARAGEDFTDAAHALGEATAHVHVTLSQVLPTREATGDVVDDLVASMRSRHRAAEVAVPRVAEYRKAIEAVFDQAHSAAWPRLQRIHADFHLGQVLAVPGRGWMLLDFEGEPLRPMAERTRPDVTLRDIAGMLRSFAYVVGEIVLGEPSRRGFGDGAHPEQLVDAAAWADAARQAFLDGYRAASGLDPRAQQVLLDAFELDKALYEAQYEARNRPSWLPIPLDGIRRILERVSGTRQATG